MQHLCDSTVACPGGLERHCTGKLCHPHLKPARYYTPNSKHRGPRTTHIPTKDLPHQVVFLRGGVRIVGS